MQFLLEIHIGPMQQFIAAARRTRDLWFGSWLMSELSKAAARGVAELEGESALIFPGVSLAELEPDSDTGVSNKISALVSDPEQAAQAAKSALISRFDSLIVAAELQSKLEEKAWQRAGKQLHSFLEFYWVAYLFDGNYVHTRAYASALLAARKNSRDFEPVNWDGIGLPKSSLDGRMETVTPQPPKGKNGAQKQYAQKMYKLFRARPGEQLSGVDLLKRLGKAKDEQKSRFPSTSHMAALPLKTQLQTKTNDTAVINAWQNYLGKLSDEIKEQERIYISKNLHLPLLGTLDGSLLFESRLLDYMDKSEIGPPKQALNAFLKNLFAGTDISEPNPYYALLVADGDSIGKAINELETKNAHRDFSQKLAAFAKKVQEIVGDGDGAVIFAGGDDVLALLPLHTAVSTAAKLAQTFRANVNGLTFSAGIAIVHHLEPLEDALELARKAEKEAKAYQKEEDDGQISKKNALAIILNKRSGVPRMVVGRWGEIDVRINEFAHYYRLGELPHGLAYQLRDMFLHLGGQTAVQNNKLLPEIMAKEAERIIKRKEGSDQAATDMTTAVKELDQNKTTIETLSSELIIAAHIAQAQKTAQLEKN